MNFDNYKLLGREIAAALTASEVLPEGWRVLGEFENDGTGTSCRFSAVNTITGYGVELLTVYPFMLRRLETRIEIIAETVLIMQRTKRQTFRWFDAELPSEKSMQEV